MKYQKGDRVKVKSWKRMLDNSSVHIDSNGDITDNKLPHTFTRQMERFCKCTATVQTVSENGNIFLVFDGEKVGPGYMFREWMLEPLDKDAADAVTVYIVEKD